MNSTKALWAVLGLALITLLTRAFFLLPDRNLPMPAWLQEGLRYAPLAALMAVIAPEIVMKDGQVLESFADARLLAAAAGIAIYFWRRNIFHTITFATATLLVTRWQLGW